MTLTRRVNDDGTVDMTVSRGFLGYARRHALVRPKIGTDLGAALWLSEWSPHADLRIKVWDATEADGRRMRAVRWMVDAGWFSDDDPSARGDG